MITTCERQILDVSAGSFHQIFRLMQSSGGGFAGLRHGGHLGVLQIECRSLRDVVGHRAHRTLLSFGCFLVGGSIERDE